MQSVTVLMRLDFDLDISVIIPTRNSMPHIQKHVAALNEWIEQVREVVVVDSESSDGTLEYIKAHLKHSNVTYLNHPPGLYQSWNAGIAKVSSDYTYIATVNDFMPFETLLQLIREAEAHQADVVVSAPKIISEESVDADRLWPIHRMCQVSSIEKSCVLSPVELLLWNSIDLPGTLIGSSASNLYRTVVLQRQPFPCDFGHAGDSAWALMGSLTLKWVVMPFGESFFWYHGGGHGSQSGRDLRLKLHDLAAQQVQGLRSGCDADHVLVEGLSELAALWGQREEAVRQYQQYRKGLLPWVLFPEAWRARRKKNQGKELLNRHVDRLLKHLLGSSS